MKLYPILLLLVCFACSEGQAPPALPTAEDPVNERLATPALIVLGTVQDAGAPHIGCLKACCRDLFAHPDPNLKVVALGVVDPENQASYLFEATPDMTGQLNMLKNWGPAAAPELPTGIFLTHAHIGHYTGLMYLGKEAINATQVPVFAMPRMKFFLENNGPWSQLVAQQNIALQELTSDTPVTLTPNLTVVPILVPHRDEFSETVGYRISGPHKKVLFIPDIDKWEKWDRDIAAEIAQVDYAFIDATFFDGAELNNRDMADIPHPFIVESMARFQDLPTAEKNKVYFIHLNHTNPGLRPASDQARQVVANGFHIARMNEVFPL
ncbi:MAG: pyrroloquinoline quinone biosynthesis protein PqqB [Bacteroidetes bacterium]|nr:MAG: pyrroloquinoline quinone biosynthesis protein PqqB [Bacteroidota bacterium]PTM09377.1 MAG: pyrroloquinoline quinone biosynthesis protein PqqB [Bacteroidota bacterium]